VSLQCCGGYVVVRGKLIEFGPAAGIKGGIAECIEEVCAAFSVRVCDLHFGWEEGGKVSIELWGFLDFKS